MSAVRPRLVRPPHRRVSQRFPEVIASTPLLLGLPRGRDLGWVCATALGRTHFSEPNAGSWKPGARLASEVVPSATSADGTDHRNLIVGDDERHARGSSPPRSSTSQFNLQLQRTLFEETRWELEIGVTGFQRVGGVNVAFTVISEPAASTVAGSNSHWRTASMAACVSIGWLLITRSWATLPATSIFASSTTSPL